MDLSWMFPSGIRSLGRNGQTTSVLGLAGSHEIVAWPASIYFEIPPLLIQTLMCIQSVTGSHESVAGPTRINFTICPVPIHMCLFYM